MKKILAIFVTTSAIALILSACAFDQSVSNKGSGSSVSTESSTDATGTTTITTTTTDIKMGADGRNKETIVSKTSTDPKGFMNKSTTSETSKTTQQ